MIEVRIRHDWDNKPIRLMEVPWDELDEVMPLIGRWGLYADGSIEVPDRLSGQFRVDDNIAYFLITIEAE